jgi:hypothetical protein
MFRRRIDRSRRSRGRRIGGLFATRALAKAPIAQGAFIEKAEDSAISLKTESGPHEILFRESGRGPGSLPPLVQPESIWDYTHGHQ